MNTKHIKIMAILFAVVLMTTSMGLQITTVSAANLPTTATLGNPAVVKTRALTYSDFDYQTEWECADEFGGSGYCASPSYWYTDKVEQHRGTVFKSKNVIDDYPFTTETINSIPDIMLHGSFSSKKGDDCYNHNGLGTTVCNDGYIMRFNQDARPEQSLTAEIIQAYVPLTSIHAESWYDHTLNVKISQSHATQVSLSIGLGGTVGYKMVGLAGSVSASASVRMQTGYSIDWTIGTDQFPGARDVYIYNEAYFIRIYGQITYDLYTFQYNGMSYELVYDHSVTEQYDTMQMITYDLSDVVSSPSKFGEFPQIEGGQYVKKSGTNVPQDYIALNNGFTVSNSETTTRSNSFGFSLGLSASGNGQEKSYKFGGSLSLAASITFSDTTQLNIRHKFSPTSTPMPIKRFYVRIHNSFGSGIEWDTAKPMSYTSSSTSATGFCIYSSCSGIYSVKKYDYLKLNGYTKDFSSLSIDIARIDKLVAYFSNVPSTPTVTKHFDGTKNAEPFSFYIQVPYIPTTTKYISIVIKIYDIHGNLNTFARTLKNMDYDDGGGICKYCLPY